MAYKSELGKYGEDLACEYLVNKGYKIIERNYRKPWGELDIIAKSPDKILVFIEVKTMRQNPAIAGLQPEDQMTASKMKKFKRAAELYSKNNENLVNDNGWRCDLLALTITGKNYIINHYENV